MDEVEWLTARFEQHRSHLRGVAYRMLSSASEADDALQEAWLRLYDHSPEVIENMQAWLTTVTGRVCLNMLRSRRRPRG
jgi:DNA-directed RNA polymerase specialized sigma24 family protein